MRSANRVGATWGLAHILFAESNQHEIESINFELIVSTSARTFVATH